MSEILASQSPKSEQSFFPKVDVAVLADCIVSDQQLGCWTPHAKITARAYEKTLKIYEYTGC